MISTFISMYSISSPGEIEFDGPISWLYYLFGAIFLILTLICCYFAYKFKDSKKEYESIAHIYGQFKKFWYLNRFLLFFSLTVICLICSILFFSMNTILISNGVS